MYSLELTNVNGCDSTVVLDLKVLENSTYEFSEEICDGEGFVFNNETLTKTGIYTAELINANGCDSTVVLDLNVLENSTYEFSEEICDGEEFAFNGEMLTNAGVYAAELINANGCDSTVVLDLKRFEK